MGKPLVNKTGNIMPCSGWWTCKLPYSWSAIINGYDKDEMKKCPFPVIPQYDAAASFGIPRRVTHMDRRSRCGKLAELL